MKNQWELKKGGELLGVLTEQNIHQPWINCKFQASPAFALYEGLFAEEIRLLNRDEMELRQQAYQKIDELELALEPLNEGGETIKDFILHIDGDRAQFRY